jgi:hypothetical protein
MILGNRLLEHFYGRIGELDGPAAAGAYQVVVVLVVPDMFVPRPPDACVVVDAGPADDAGLYEQREVAVHGGERKGVPLLPEEIEDMVRVEVAVYIANYSQ